jgi:photosystem II stability/assembly factor-like uncharacterized protein
MTLCLTRNSTQFPAVAIEDIIIQFMKSRLSLIAFAFLLHFFAGISVAQINVWRQQNPPKAGVTFEAVQMVTANLCYACGDNATFAKSTDGGETWDIQSPAAGLFLGYYRSLHALNFLDSNYGMVCGDSGRVIKTTDGGKSWKVFEIGDKNSKLLSIAVIDTNIAIVVGSEGFLKHTTDGGKSWRTYILEKFVNFTTVRELRPDFITLGGYEGTLLVSRDSGNSWSNIPITVAGKRIAENIYGHLFTDENNASVIGENGFVCTTTDGGNSWARQFVDTLITTAQLNGIDGKDPHTMSIIGDYGTILYSTYNGSLHWHRNGLRFQQSITGISFFDKLTALAVGEDGIVIKTMDGGKSWQFIPERPLIDNLNGIAFQKGDTSVGIAVGFGIIMRTSNGGETWAKAKFDSIVSLKSVTFVDANNIFAVGENGVIAKSTDAGLTWNVISSGTSAHLLSICFGTENSGWISGNGGTLLSSSDGGNTWIKYPFHKKRNLTGISFSDSLHGYLCSDKGVYTTIDAGATWKNPDDATYFIPCNGISSPSPNVVCVIGTGCGGSSGTHILTSHDAGKTWRTTSTGGFGYNVQFTDDLHGSVADGGILHTTDGGMTWIAQELISDKPIVAVSFGTNKAGTAVGSRGRIYRRTTNE